MATLNLSKNNFQDEGTIKLATVLQQLTSLTKVDLSNNQIRKKGESVLLSILAQLPLLTQIEYFDDQVESSSKPINSLTKDLIEFSAEENIGFIAGVLRTGLRLTALFRSFFFVSYTL